MMQTGIPSQCRRPFGRGLPHFPCSPQLAQKLHVGTCPLVEAAHLELLVGALEAFLAEIAGFPDGRHDDQVDALSYIAAYSGKVINEARRWGLELGRLRPPPVKVQVIPPKSRDQELHERRQWRQWADA